MELTTDLHLVLGLRMIGGVSLLTIHAYLETTEVNFVIIFEVQVTVQRDIFLY